MGNAIIMRKAPLTSVAVTGPLTDTELRATAVPVSGPLTDTELRATAVPVSGPLTDTELRATAVPVSGPLTDTELRATAVPVNPRVPTAITLYAVTLTDAATEYSQALPATCQRVVVYNRTGNALRAALETGKVATPTDPYRTIPAGAEWDSGPVLLTSATVYLATANAGDVVEIEVFS